jgi:hypothetical protein
MQRHWAEGCSTWEPVFEVRVHLDDDDDDDPYGNEDDAFWPKLPAKENQA